MWRVILKSMTNEKGRKGGRKRRKEGRGRRMEYEGRKKCIEKMER